MAEALDILLATLGPQNPDTASIMARHARVLHATGSIAAATAQARAARSLLLETMTGNHALTAEANAILAECLLATGQSVEAEALLLEARTALKAKAPPSRAAERVDHLLCAHQPSP